MDFMFLLAQQQQQGVLGGALRGALIGAAVGVVVALVLSLLKLFKKPGGPPK